VANPQTEDGHIKIANDLWEAITRQRLSGSEFQVLLAVIRKTYGYNKKSDWITNRQLAAMTGLDAIRASENVNRLKERGILTITEKRKGYERIIAINKDYDTWKPLRKTVRVEKTQTLTDFRDKPSRNSVTPPNGFPLPHIIKAKHTKDNKANKETLTEKREGSRKKKAMEKHDDWRVSWNDNGPGPVHAKLGRKADELIDLITTEGAADGEVWDIDKFTLAVTIYKELYEAGVWEYKWPSLTDLLSRTYHQKSGPGLTRFLPRPGYDPRKELRSLKPKNKPAYTGQVGGGRRFIK
jgi:phage replication O-like protein O